MMKKKKKKVQYLSLQVTGWRGAKHFFISPLTNLQKQLDTGLELSVGFI